MNTTYTVTNNINEATFPERPWWTVRRSLLATLAAATLVLGAMFAPTPLAKWVFGEYPFIASSR